MITNLLNYARTKVRHSFDPSTMLTNEGIQDSKSEHKGLYLGVVSSEGDEIAREGFIKDGNDDLLKSTDLVVNNLVDKLKHKNYSLSRFMTSQVHLTVIRDCKYMADPMLWDENKDGIYFQWGQKYRGLYLPYQIQRMDLTKAQVLDRLCAWEAGVASNLWKNEAGLVFRLTCDTIS